jgi:hypothetical protein
MLGLAQQFTNRDREGARPSEGGLAVGESPAGTDPGLVTEEPGQGGPGREAGQASTTCLPPDRQTTTTTGE